MDTQDIIERLNSGDNEILKKIYSEYRVEFAGWASRDYGLQHHEALEVFQLSVVALYENVRSGKLTEMRSSLKTYLFSIGRNKALEFHRLRNKRLIDRIDAQTRLTDRSDPDEISEREKLFVLLERAMERIGNPCRELLVLSYRKSLSQNVISEMMGYKDRNTVKTRKYKCLKRLKSIIEEIEKEDGRDE